jgi:hypothetical protein
MITFAVYLWNPFVLWTMIPNWLLVTIICLEAVVEIFGLFVEIVGKDQ